MLLLSVANLSCDQAIQRIWKQLSEAGLQVVRTFDLKVARLAHLDCLCPQHGQESCDCQMAVLLVYDGACSPLSLVAHGHARRTWLYMVDIPQQKAEARLERRVRQILAPEPDLITGDWS